MDIEELVKKHLDANWYGTDSTGYADVAEAMHAALTEADAALAMEHNLAMLQVEAAHAIELRAYEATVQNQAERIRQLEAKLVPSPSCRECANRGRVNGLSQETYCDSCVWQGQSFRVNQYATQPKETEAAGKYGLQVDAERVPDGWKLVPTEATSDMVKAGMMVGDVGLYAIYGVMIDAAPRRCHLCDYQHGHKIGCVNNPVDIALLAAAPAKEDSSHE